MGIWKHLGPGPVARSGARVPSRSSLNLPQAPATAGLRAGVLGPGLSCTSAQIPCLQCSGPGSATSAPGRSRPGVRWGRPPWVPASLCPLAEQPWVTQPLNSHLDFVQPLKPLSLSHCPWGWLGPGTAAGDAGPFCKEPQPCGQGLPAWEHSYAQLWGALAPPTDTQSWEPRLGTGAEGHSGSGVYGGLEAWTESKLRTVLASGTPPVRQGDHSGAFLMDSVSSWRS